MGEREVEGIVRVNARVCVVFEEGAFWQVGGRNVGKGRCGSLFFLGGLSGAGTLDGRDRRGGGEGRRDDALLHLYGGIDDPVVDVGWC
jgi:hypothetical protein